MEHLFERSLWRRRGLFLAIPDRDERDETIPRWNAQQLRDGPGVRLFIACDPAVAQAVRARRDDYVLGGRATILEPVLRISTEDGDAHRGVSDIRPRRRELRERDTGIWICDHDEFPWLNIPGRGGEPSGVNNTNSL